MNHWATRTFLVVFGAVSLAIGVVGIFVPLLPTTPFVLLAAACFAKSSPRFQAWLLGHRTFGPMIRDWRANGAISSRAKGLAMLSIALSLALVWTTVRIPAARVAATATLACVVIFILSRPRPPRT